jgi:hypothetical protein
MSDLKKSDLAYQEGQNYTLEFGKTIHMIEISKT